MKEENKDKKKAEEPCCSESEMMDCCPKPEKPKFKCSCGGFCG